MASTAVDVFEYLPEHRLAVCRTCHFAVLPSQATTHLAHHHRDIPARLRPAIVRELAGWPDICQQPSSGVAPAGVPEPFSSLALFTDGLQCQLEPQACRYICRSLGTLRGHWRRAHQWAPGTHGGCRSSQRQAAAAQRRADAYRSVWCQRFFVAHGGTPYFEVARPAQHLRTLDKSLAEGEQERQQQQEQGQEQDDSFLQDVLADLAGREATSSVVHGGVQRPRHQQEVSPWLELTRWAGYLSGHPLPELAALAAVPDPSVCNDEINVFDQSRINSFLQQSRASDRPLMIKLQKSTWRRYTSVWKALLCFVCRTADADCPIALEHRFTSYQAACLDSTLANARALQHAAVTDVDVACPAAVEQARDRLDATCLDLCIALLDQDLRGRLYESATVGFLAVLGIDVARNNLREAYCFSPRLSGFIKISQLLTI
ncbi:hypothetical protein M409DRAFT_31110 [Zasmidium cellare ATCC 36951]|uniref:C2H2-type domain-containing protein n=1 Tax=Zasmidium cellare ATCC 36951 TaxID=1080233 RepID=A0A6A6BU95_ZASCE|nr:uncharacterized protein M409DRAFT_31110 [Zasmidium cellare ATCC 36951]KAF2158374.1 hypothetical protein M409DRAFT_31110 [Zasmidium cellare ATCC 36951]